MGLRSFLFRGSDQQVPAGSNGGGMPRASVIEGDGTFETEVVGESNYQDALWRAVSAAEPTERGYRHRTVALLRSEPTNPYDRNAVQVLIDNRLVGYLSREDAVAHKPLMASHGHSARCPALIVGGFQQSSGRASLGVWLDLLEADVPPARAYASASSTGTSAFLARDAPPTQGLFKGKHYTQYVEDIKALKRHNALEEALELLLSLLDAVEEEANAEGRGVAPWYYEQAAIVCRKRRDFAGEVAILERFAAQPAAPGASPPVLLERLDKARTKLTNEASQNR